MKITKNDIDRMLDLFANEGWTQKIEHDDQGYCLIGACNELGIDSESFATVMIPVAATLYPERYDWSPEELEEYEGYDDDIVEFNDNDRTDIVDVRSVLLATKERL